jgi:hypothetical protein
MVLSGGAPSINRFNNVRSALTEVDPCQVAASAGALTLLPTNGHRLWRLGTLAALAAEVAETSTARGLRQSQLRALILTGDIAGVAAQQEDPFEDVLTEELVFFGGSYLIGSGLASDCAYIVRLVIRSLLLSDVLPPKLRSDLTILTQSTLALSDHVLRRAGLRRHAFPTASPLAVVDIPGQSRLRRLANEMIFSAESVAAIDGLDPAILEPLTLEAGSRRFDDADLVQGFADQWPLIRFGKNFVVAKPFDLLLALRHHIVTQAVGELAAEAVAAAFGAAVDEDVLDSFRRLGLDVNVVPRDQSQLWTEMSAQIDTDIEMLCLVCSDPMVDLSANPYGRYDTHGLLDAVHARFEQAARASDHQVLGLLIGQTAGRAASFGLRMTDRENLSREFMSAADLQIIARVEHGDPLALWKFAQAHSRLRADGQVMSFGTLDLYSAYYGHDRNFDYLGGATLVTVAPGSAAEIRRDTKASRDFHGGFYIDQTVREVEREDENGLDPRFYHLTEIREPRLILHIGNAPLDLWVTGPDGGERVRLSWALIETVAYWLNELAMPLHERLTTLSRAIPCLQLSIDVEDPHFWFSSAEDPGGEDVARCRAERYEVSVTLGPRIRRAAPSPDNRADRMLVSVIIDAIDVLCEAYGDEAMSLDEKRALRDAVAPEGMKKHLLVFPMVGNELIAKADGPARLVQTADVSAARQLVGEHVTTAFGLRDQVVPADQRQRVVRSSVEYLLAQVQVQLDSVRPEGLLEEILAANERIIAESEHSRAVLPARLATYPEADRQGRLRDETAQASQAAVCCRFLAEYVAAQPPSGSEPWSVARYDRAMALTAEMIGWAYLADAFYYQMTDVGLLVNEEGQLRLEEQDRYELGRGAYFDQHVADQRDTMGRIFTRRFDVPSSSSPSELVSRINPLMLEEAGASLTELGQLLHAANAYATSIGAEQVSMDRSAAIAMLGTELEWEKDKIDRSVSYLTMGPRAKFLDPPDGDWHDVVPSRFARRWSLNRRPFIARGQELLWGRRQVLVALNVILGQIFSGRFQALADSSALREELGRLASESGVEFEHDVADVFRARSRFAVEESVTSLGGHKLERPNGDTLGEIDVLVADTVARVIHGVECKGLAGALTPSETASELSEHFDGEGTSSSRHAERISWLDGRRADALKHFNISEDASLWRVHGMFVTGRPVMAVYIRDVPFEIVAFRDLDAWIAGQPQTMHKPKRSNKRRKG